jgi:hypothetical protein
VWAEIVMFSTPPFDPLRYVHTEATLAPPDGTIDTTHGLFAPPIASSVGAGPSASEISTTADQTSFTPETIPPDPSAIFGDGLVTAFVTANPPPFGYSVLADSFFDVFFTVDAPETYIYSAGVSWEGTSPPFGGFSQVTFTNVTTATIISDISRGSAAQGVTAFGPAFVPLVPGDTYHLFARSLIDGGSAVPGSFSAVGGWRLALEAEPVPEPSSLTLLVGLGISLLMAYRRRPIVRGTRHSQTPYSPAA